MVRPRVLFLAEDAFNLMKRSIENIFPRNYDYDFKSCDDNWRAYFHLTSKIDLPSLKLIYDLYIFIFEISREVCYMFGCPEDDEKAGFTDE